MDGPGFGSQSDVRTNPDSASLRGVNLPRHEDDQSLSSNAECIYPSVPPLRLHGVHGVTLP